MLKIYYAPLRRINSLTLRQNSSLTFRYINFLNANYLMPLKYEPNKERVGLILIFLGEGFQVFIGKDGTVFAYINTSDVTSSAFT